MSIKGTLQQIARMGVMAAALASSLPKEAHAQDANGSAGNTAPTTQHINNQNWTWGEDRASQQAKTVYEKLPDEYKVFENKTFEERTEIAEEWRQRDFIKRSKQRENFLKQHPNARVKDLYPQATGILSEAPLAKYKPASASWDSKIASDQMSGYLSADQAKIANELLRYGRPLATVDSNLPYAQKLQLCGFDVLSRVAAGERKSSLTPRDLSIFVAQLDVAKAFNEMPENAECPEIPVKKHRKKRNEKKHKQRESVRCHSAEEMYQKCKKFDQARTSKNYRGYSK